MIIELNYLAIVIATIANFFVCYLWYNPLFGKSWATELGFQTNERIPTPNLLKALGLTLLSCLFISSLMAVAHGLLGQFVQHSSSGKIAISAICLIFVGLVVPMLLQGTAWEKRSWKLFSIHAGYYLTILTVAAATLLIVS